MPRGWTGAFVMRSFRLAARTVTRLVVKYFLVSVVNGHICPTIASTLERPCSHKTRNGQVLKQEPEFFVQQQQARHENSSGFKTQAHSCTCLFVFINHAEHMFETESRNHWTFFGSMEASCCSVAEVADTRENSRDGYVQMGLKRQYQSVLRRTVFQKRTLNSSYLI